jgi:hypothetical protein
VSLIMGDYVTIMRKRLQDVIPISVELYGMLSKYIKPESNDLNSDRSIQVWCFQFDYLTILTSSCNTSSVVVMVRALAWNDL